MTWHTIEIIEPNGPADARSEGPGCWAGDCPHSPDHAAQLKGQAERGDDAEIKPGFHEGRSMDALLKAVDGSKLRADRALYRGGSDAKCLGCSDGAGHVFDLAAAAITLEHVALGERKASAEAR